MCLGVKDEKIQWKKKYGTGWKVFKKQGNIFRSEMCGTKEPFPINKYVNEKDYRAPTYNQNYIGYVYRYPMGFHIFLEKTHAREWGGGTVMQVRFRNVVATGIQIGYPCVVAKEMKILPKERKRQCKKTETTA